MQAHARDLIPLILVTGFLGAGKTTLLQRLMARRRLLAVVNELSAQDVDGARLAKLGAAVHTISGGSIFCRCKVTDFLAALGMIDAQWSEHPGLEGVVVETSGIADPRVCGRMLAESGLARRFRLQRSLCVVDPGSCLRLLATLPNLGHQLEAADTIIVNHCDRHPPELVAATRQAVRERRPQAQILETSFCALDLDPLAPAASEEPATSGDYAPCRNPDFEVLQPRPPAEVDLERLRAALVAFGDGLYRAKGCVWTAEGLRRIDLAAGAWSEGPGREAVGPVVLIGAGPALPGLTALAAAIEAGAFTILARYPGAPPG